jgi:hypothetical protein
MAFFLHRAFGLLLGGTLATLTVSCASSKRPMPSSDEAVSSTSSTRPSSEAKPAGSAETAPSCGHEVQVHGRGINDSARDCLWDAYQAGREADLAMTMHTVEGDPITYTLHVRSKTAIDFVEDNKDSFGSPGIRRSTCSGLERGAEMNGHRGFRLQGCQGTVKTFELR